MPAIQGRQAASNAVILRFQSVTVFNLCVRVTQFSRDCLVKQLARKTAFLCHICGTKYKHCDMPATLNIAAAARGGK